MARPLRVYLAGPEVFLPDAPAIGQAKKALCAKHGFEGLYPADNEISPDILGTRLDTLIYRADMAMIKAADFGIFNLTPFRGPSADAGTVFELGTLIGLNKPVFGYTNAADDLLARVEQYWRQLGQPLRAPTDGQGTQWHDPDGLAVESFGNADNLMIDVALAEQGHPIVRHAAKPAALYRDLTAFEECLRMAAQTLSSPA